MNTDNPRELPFWWVDIFTEMFRRVGDKFSPEIVATPGWFLAHEWSVEEEGDFMRWVDHYLCKNRKRIFGYAMPYRVIRLKKLPMVRLYCWTYKEKGMDS